MPIVPDVDESGAGVGSAPSPERQGSSDTAPPTLTGPTPRPPAGSAVKAPLPPEKWRDHVIVCGLSALGLRVVEQLLATATKVVVIDQDAPERSVRVVRSWGVPYVVGNARRREGLAAAGIAGAAALVSMDDDDVFSLELALLARAMRSDVRVIMQMNNERVGRAVERVTGYGTVLDSAALAAPAFVDTLTRHTYRKLRLGDLDLRLAETCVPSSGRLRDQVADLIPVAVTPVSGAARVCPDLDEGIAAGDRVVVVGSPAQIEAMRGRQAGGADSGDAGPVVRWFRALGRARTGSVSALLHALVTGADRALKATIAATVALAIVAAMVINYGYHSTGQTRMGPLDALYTTVQTIVTVGYGDFPFGNQPAWLIVFDIGLMVVGTFLVAITFAQITDLLVSRRLASTLGQQRAAHMRGHTVIIGLGSVGVRVMRRLVALGHDVAVVDRDPENRFTWAARDANVPLIIADATVPGTLDAANIANASGAAVMTGDDLTNIETGLAIRDEFERAGRDAPVVLRLFDRYLSRTVELSFRFRDVRSTAQIAAPFFVAAALGLDIVTAFSVAKRNVVVGRLRVSATGGLVGVPVEEVGQGVRVVALTGRSGSDASACPLRPGTSLDAGDRALVVGTAEDILRILARNR